MKFNLITLFPGMFSETLSQGVVGQAFERGELSVEFVNPRDYAKDNHHSVDDRPFGGGDGMVMMAEPLKESLEVLESKNELGHVVYLSPQGERWSDQKARTWAKGFDNKTITLICGRYAGIDERIITEFVDEEVSIGDYVLSGGEVAAMVVIDSTARFLPGVLGNVDSPDNETFSHGLLEAPQWTRPREILDQEVPEFILSGDHKLIQKNRFYLSLLRTALRRPDLMDDAGEVRSKMGEAVKWLDSLDLSEKQRMGFDPCELIQIESWAHE